MLTFATRPSNLARWQTQSVIQALQEAWPGLDCQEIVITTQGDRIIDRPLPEIGGKGLFTRELEIEIRSGRVRAAVHSLKDLPVDCPAGLVIGAIPARGDVRDALVSSHAHTLQTLPEGACVGTSSPRRAAQLLAHRPDLRVEPVRGNVDTRVRKALQGHYDAILLASAGLTRLGLDKHISQWLSVDVMLPAPGQAALAVQCRDDDEQILRCLSAIEDPPARLATTAERSFLAALGAGCSLPIAAYAYQDDEQLVLSGLVASPDGKRIFRLEAIGDDPKLLGIELAHQALAQGAAGMLSPGN
jgi:hydroxymethylbilane synthase